MTRTAFLALMASSLTISACTTASDSPNSSAVVLNRLAPGILLSNETHTGWNLIERMEYADVPAVAVTFVDSSGLAWTRAVGTPLRGSGDTLHTDTRFMVKSISKPVAAFAAMRLVDQGILDLDRPLNDYLDRWNVPQNEFTLRTSPTLRHLLAHRAGFTMWGVPSFAEGEKIPDILQIMEGNSKEDYGAVRIDFEPGTRSRYSGGGYSVLQLLLEDTTGESFPELMHRLVFQPLGMRHSQFHIGVPDSLKSITATGHDADGQPLPGRWEAIVQMAAGGLITTSKDLGIFVFEVMRALRGESDLLSAAVATEMVRDHGDGWGLGFDTEGSGSDPVFSHTGSGDGFRSAILGLPGRQQGIVVLVNSDGMRAAELRHEIIRGAALVYGWNGLKPGVRQVIDPGREWLASLEGRYRYSDGSVTTISLSPAGLNAAWGDGTPTSLYPEDSTHFFSRSGESFVFEREGASLVWSGDFGSFKADRITE